MPGLYLPGLAELCLSAIKIFEWPCAANVYASPSRLEAMDENRYSQKRKELRVQNLQDFRKFTKHPKILDGKVVVRNTIF